MNLLTKIIYAFRPWVITKFGQIPFQEYKFEMDGPIPKLLRISHTAPLPYVDLIRLDLREKYTELTGLDELSKAINQISRLNPRIDYGYKLADIPIDDSLISGLVMWSLKLYPDKITISPDHNILFRIQKVA